MKKYIVLSVLVFTFAVSTLVFAKEKTSTIYLKSSTALVEPASEFSDGFTTILVQCENNDAATGGAFKYDSILPEGSQQTMIVTESYPTLGSSGEPNGWSITVKNLDGAADNWTVSALCHRDSMNK